MNLCSEKQCSKVGNNVDTLSNLESISQHDKCLKCYKQNALNIARENTYLKVKVRYMNCSCDDPFSFLE